MVIMKHQESHVHKIKSSVTSDYFIAPTTQQVSQGIKTFKRNHRECKAGKRGYTAVYKAMDAGDYTYETLEKVKCGSEVELWRIEQEWMHRMEAGGPVLEAWVHRVGAGFGTRSGGTRKPGATLGHVTGWFVRCFTLVM
jgi:hypothetical protein